MRITELLIGLGWHIARADEVPGMPKATGGCFRDVRYIVIKNGLPLAKFNRVLLHECGHALEEEYKRRFKDFWRLFSDELIKEMVAVDEYRFKKSGYSIDDFESARDEAFAELAADWLEVQCVFRLPSMRLNWEFKRIMNHVITILAVEVIRNKG